jgi:hypothetical protein
MRISEPWVGVDLGEVLEFIKRWYRRVSDGDFVFLGKGVGVVREKL